MEGCTATSHTSLLCWRRPRRQECQSALFTSLLTGGTLHQPAQVSCTQKGAFLYFSLHCHLHGYLFCFHDYHCLVSVTTMCVSMTTTDCFHDYHCVLP